MQDVSLYISARHLDTILATYAYLEAATSVTYTFTTQNNSKRGETMIHISSGNALYCPVRATIQCIKHLRLHSTNSTAPITSYYRNSLHISVEARDVAGTLHSIITANVHRTGAHAHEISMRSLRADGAMALLYGNVNFDLIRIFWRWHSDATIRYSHMQVQPVMQHFASTMFNNGTYKFLSKKMVPVQDTDHDD
jgi:hypothetical protein